MMFGRRGHEKRTLVTQMLIWFKRCRWWRRKIWYGAAFSSHTDRGDRLLRGDACTHIIARSRRGIAVWVMCGCCPRLSCIVLWVISWDRGLINVGRRCGCVLREARLGWWSEFVCGGVIGATRGMWRRGRIVIIVMIVCVVILWRSFFFIT